MFLMIPVFSAIVNDVWDIQCILIVVSTEDTRDYAFNTGITDLTNWGG